MTANKLVDREYWVGVYELDDVVPRRDSLKPNLYVATSISPPDIHFASIRGNGGKHKYSNSLVSVRSDLGPSHMYLNKEDATTARKELVKGLRSEGYTVNGDTKVWTVYVIQVGNPTPGDASSGFLYVGETSKEPEKRLQEHIDQVTNDRGPLFARAFKKMQFDEVPRLRPDLAPAQKFFDRATSLVEERRCFDALARLGFNVKGGH